MRGRIGFIAGIALMIMLAGTSGIAAAQGASLPAGMADTDWNLVSLQSAPGTVQDTTGKGITLRFDTNGTANGMGGCNNFTGGYTVGTGSQLTFTQFASTLKLCEPEISTLEGDYLTLLQGMTSYTLDGATGLQLANASGGVLTYTKAQPATLPATGAASDNAVMLALLGGLLCTVGLWFSTRRTALVRHQ